ncbi:MAG: tetracycline resistance ribosomal protection protein Tet(36), partial [Eubacteriales bacterium]|nr:tetracycline resistance ribosomal protection protein Tet(36) [Eubacteriales bacterium]
GRVQVEVLQALLAERFGLDASFGPLLSVYQEQPRGTARAQFEMGQFPNPHQAAIGLRVEPAAAGAGLVYESRVSPGYLNPSFQAAVRDGVTKGCQRGNYGWEVTDIRVVFEYAVYSSVTSTPADFRRLAPYVLGVALHRAGTRLLEPFCAFELDVPDVCAGRALFDLKQMRADVQDIRAQGENTLITGKAPEQRARDYPMELMAYTQGRGAFFTRPLGYEPYAGPPAYAPTLPKVPDKMMYLFLRGEEGPDASE